MTRERRVCKNLLLVGSNHYALSADNSIPNNTLSEQTILAEKSGWQVANGSAAIRYRSLRLLNLAQLRLQTCFLSVETFNSKLL